MRINLTCDQCGQVFETQSAWAKRNKHHFCSRTCGDAWWSAQRRADPELGEKMAVARAARGEPQEYRKRNGKLEHRLVMEEVLGRPLLPSEIVHHVDEVKLHNDPSNLEVVEWGEHSRRHRTKYVGCSIKNCSNKHHSKGYCDRHYRQNYESNLRCEVDGCESAMLARRLCSKHYQRVRVQIQLSDAS